MSFFGNITRIFGDADERFLKRLRPLVERISALEKNFENLKDGDLPKKTEEFKERLKKGETLDDLLPEAFALAREAAKRTLNQRHYDVQLLGGIILHQGKIAEMKTGEGKTLVATLPAYLNALLEKGAHIVTVNDYLSRRDAVWMGQIYNALGLTVGCINHEASYLYNPSQTGNYESRIMNKGNGNHNSKLDNERDALGSFKVVHEFLRPCSRKEAYAADITYGTNNEFGFDYLRDNMAYGLTQISQSRQKRASLASSKNEAGNHYFAIVDEVDSILIDEARTPLIISAPDEESGELYRSFSKITPRLQKDVDYNVDEKMKAAILTDEGIGKVEKILGVENIYTEKGIKYVHHLEQALRAQALFQRDRDYVVKNNEVIIVDEFTGRLMPGRRWSDGLHQAIEAKEGVSVQRESRTMASITFQNYFRMYEKLSGMTGTALTSAEEFHKVYNLEVLAVPTNKPLAREDLPDIIFQTEKGKFQAVVEKIKECRKKSQPILVGTVSIEKNEKLSALLEREGVPHELLNAKNHEKEGAIIAQAGRLGAVTIATNMAGRGVDIILGGNPPSSKDAQKVKEAGGLFVLGTERHEARRIDNQLRGRSGRQGDPGQTRFFVSLEDDLMRIFGSEKIKKMMGAFGIPEDEPIENKIVSRALESAQAKIEGFNFDARRHILEYDDVMNRQRQSIYRSRCEILFGGSKEIEKRAAELVEDELTDLVDFHAQGDIAGWNIKEIFENLRARLGADESADRPLIKINESGGLSDEKREKIKDYVLELWRNLLVKKKKELGDENFQRLLKILMIQIIDMLWVGHLEAMDYLRSSVRLRAYGQHDPLVEYKNEGARMFTELKAAIRTHLSHLILKISGQPLVGPTAKTREIHQSDQNAQSRIFGDKKIGRNDPCPCGKKDSITGNSIKYKKCCYPKFG